MPGRRTLALSFMHFLDENRPAGKMCLSNGECADIEKAFEASDCVKIVKYVNKYAWKPSEEQMEAFRIYLYHPQYIANSDDMRIKLVEPLYNDLKKL